MCTVSFIPKQRGFFLAMNRDEKRARVKALPPAIIDFSERRVILPREPGGGTWIAANDRGICVALINWHRIEREPARSIISRGEVTMAVAGKTSTDEIAAGLTALKVQGLRPFRLIAIVPSENNLTEWRWDLERLSARQHPWQPKHWFSSGFDERRAELERKNVCDVAHQQSSIGTLASLRRLHRSHSPRCGPFSICMHRPDAVTVSYTEVVLSDRRVTMRYKSGAACSPTPLVTKTVRL